MLSSSRTQRRPFLRLANLNPLLSDCLILRRPPRSHRKTGGLCRRGPIHVHRRQRPWTGTTNMPKFRKIIPFRSYQNKTKSASLVTERRPFFLRRQHRLTLRSTRRPRRCQPLLLCLSSSRPRASSSSRRRLRRGRLSLCGWGRDR